MELALTHPLWSLLSAVLLGFLIGLEREKKRETRGSIFAGVRTFPLISLFGATIALLSQIATFWVAPAGLLAFTTILGIAYWRASTEKVGGTSEVAALVAFGLGLMAGFGELIVALAGAVLATAVLSLRDELHGLAGAVGREDMFAIVQFAAVSLVVLPIVPDETFGPWGVWNPRTIWLLVVLISGISFVGYLAAKVVGARRGISFSGLLGGLASSTAVTLSFSGRSMANKRLDMVFAVGVLAASTVMAPRLLLILAVAYPPMVIPALVPFGVLFLVTMVGWLVVHRLSHTQDLGSGEVHNPFELKTALKFAAVFAGVLLIARAAEEWLGEGGVYIASALAGITQMDAITLALGRQVTDGLDTTVAAKGLAFAAASNNLFKAMLALSLGTRQFGLAVTVTLVLAGLACIAAAWFLLPLLS